MGLLWTIAVCITYFFLLRDHTLDGIWIMLFVSLLLMVCGLAVYLGGAMLLAGFNTMTKQERSQYNVKALTSFMGVFIVLLSYFALFMALHFAFFVVFIIAVLAVVIYVNVSRRFRANGQQ